MRKKTDKNNIFIQSIGTDRPVQEGRARPQKEASDEGLQYSLVH